MSASKSLPRIIPVKVFEGTDDERTVEVQKLPLGRAAQLALAFRSLPEKIRTMSSNPKVRELFDQADDTPLDQLALQLVEYLPDILEVATDAFIDILVVGTGIGRDELEQVGLDEASDLFLAVLTVNDLKRIQDNVKNALSRLGINRQALQVAQTTSTSKT